MEDCAVENETIYRRCFRRCYHEDRKKKVRNTMLDINFQENSGLVTGAKVVPLFASLKDTRDLARPIFPSSTRSSYNRADGYRSGKAFSRNLTWCVVPQLDHCQRNPWIIIRTTLIRRLTRSSSIGDLEI